MIQQKSYSIDVDVANNVCERTAKSPNLKHVSRKGFINFASGWETVLFGMKEANKGVELTI